MVQFILLFAFLIPLVLFMLTEHNLLKVIRSENRLMQPGMVWLQFIPFFGLLWQFFVVRRIAGSIRNEIASRQDNDDILGFSDFSAVETMDKQPTLKIGIAYCILVSLGGIINLSHLTDYSWTLIIPLVCMFSGIICWIIYWVKLVQYKRKLNRYSI